MNSVLWEGASEAEYKKGRKGKGGCCMRKSSSQMEKRKCLPLGKFIGSIRRYDAKKRKKLLL